jgi:sigma-B regulation protein RsbQ
MNSFFLKKNNIHIEGNLNAVKTIVFSNGFGTDQTSWDSVKKAFKDEYRLVLYDNVGAGQADPAAYSPIKYNTLKTYAKDLTDIFSELKLKDSIVVAHSVSSMISLLATVAMPEAVSKMVFVGASPRYIDDLSAGYTGGFTQEALNNMYETMTSNYYAWASGFSKMAMGNPDRPELGEYFADTLSAIRPDIALSVSKVIFESDVREDLPALQKEVLLLQSREDIAVPKAVAQYLNAHIEGSTLKYLDATGHFPHISAPEEVIRHIQSFI